MDKFLLINLNNTTTKFALADSDRIEGKKILSTAKLTARSVRRITASWRFDRALLGSVVPSKNTIFRTLLRKRLLEVTPALDLGIGIDYPEPSHIGADRLANAVAVTRRHGSPAVVVDFGTAVTFDIIDRNANYIGGVIAPGLGVMTDYLYQKTALLPRIDLSEPTDVIGKSTRGAMLAGAVYGYRGLVRQILTEIVARMEGKVRIVGTGSYAELIAAKLPELQIIDQELTLEGLRLIALRNS
jgi:type III pantothenate kinase